MKDFTGVYKFLINNFENILIVIFVTSAGIYGLYETMLFNNFFIRLQYFFFDFYGYLTLLIVSSILLFLFINYIYKAGISLQKKKILICICFTFFILILMDVALEAYFRYKYDQTDGLGFLQTNQRWMRRHVQYNNIVYRDNKDYLIQKPKGTVRIGVVGDSLTFGWGIKNVNDRFSNLLESDLKQKDYKVQVYNFGLPGQNTCNEIKQFRQFDYIPMDIIIWEYYFNGVEPCDYRNAGNKILKETRTLRNPLLVFISDRSFLFDYLYWRLTSYHDSIYRQLRNADLKQYSNTPVLRDHIKDIATFSAELKFDGNLEVKPRTVIAILFPLLNLWNQNYYPGIAAQNKMADIISSNGVIVVDMLPALMGKTKEQLTINRFDAHPNEYVNKIAAQKLEEQIIPLLQKE